MGGAAGRDTIVWSKSRNVRELLQLVSIRFNNLQGIVSCNYAEIMDSGFSSPQPIENKGENRGHALR